MNQNENLVQHNAEYERVHVDIRFSYNLPADLVKREEMYGTTDAAQCVRIDLENDPAAFLLDTDMEVLSTHIDGPGGGSDAS